MAGIKIRTLLAALTTMLLATSCVDRSPMSMNSVVQLFVDNQSDFDAAVMAIDEYSLFGARINITRDGYFPKYDERIKRVVKAPSLWLTMVKLFPVIETDEGDEYVVEFLYRSQFFDVIQNERWALFFDQLGVAKASADHTFITENVETIDPQFSNALPRRYEKEFLTCDGIDLKLVVRDNPNITSARCNLTSAWAIGYSVN